MTRAPFLHSTDDSGVVIRVKAVPGARSDAIAGLLGDRLKVRVSAPAEGGKANAAICACVARALGLKPSAVSVVGGPTNPEKLLRIEGAGVDDIAGLAG